MEVCLNEIFLSVMSFRSALFTLYVDIFKSLISHDPAISRIINCGFISVGFSSGMLSVASFQTVGQFVYPIMLLSLYFTSLLHYGPGIQIKHSLLIS